jgi:hypothetical protein
VTRKDGGPLTVSHTALVVTGLFHVHVEGESRVISNETAGDFLVSFRKFPIWKLSYFLLTVAKLNTALSSKTMLVLYFGHILKKILKLENYS